MIIKLIDELDENQEFSCLVDILNEFLMGRQDVISVLEKNLIVLLVTKMEVFLERKTSDWFEALQRNRNLTVGDLSDVIKKEIVRDTYELLQDDLRDGRVCREHKVKLNNFQVLIDDKYPLDKIHIDFKITLNSHGGNEIKSLLRKIGIDNIFDLMEDMDVSLRSEEVEQVCLSSKYDYEGMVNRLVNYRNSIVHEDLMPSISIQDMNDFINCINLLGMVVLDYLDSICEEAKEMVVC